MAYFGFQAGPGKHLTRSAKREIFIQPNIDFEEMRNLLFRLRERSGIFVGWQLDTLFTSLQLSLGECSTFDFTFNSVVRR